jgi:hypothetical protein
VPRVSFYATKQAGRGSSSLARANILGFSFLGALRRWLTAVLSGCFVFQCANVRVLSSIVRREYLVLEVVQPAHVVWRGAGDLRGAAVYRRTDAMLTWVGINATP